jgi:hypothetical protein
VAQKANSSSRDLVAPGKERLQRFERQFPKQSLGRVRARVPPALLSGVEALKLF